MINTTNNTQMNQQIATAIDVILNIYESIDDYRFPADVRIKHNALGQCLRSLKETLPNEPTTDC